LEFLNAVIYQYTESTVFIPDDPKNIAISVFTDILKTSSIGYSLEELTKTACEKNEYVKSYLLGNKNNSNHLLKLESNRKLGSVYGLLIENSHIDRVKEKPIVLQWINPNPLSDTTDIPNNKMNFNVNNNGDKTMSDMSDKKYDPFKEESSRIFQV
jgi:hypothetical protein